MDERDPFTQMEIDAYRRLRSLYGDDVEIKVVTGSMVPKGMVYVMPTELLRKDATAEEIEAYRRRFGIIENIDDES